MNSEERRKHWNLYTHSFPEASIIYFMRNGRSHTLNLMHIVAYEDLYKAYFEDKLTWKEITEKFKLGNVANLKGLLNFYNFSLDRKHLANVRPRKKLPFDVCPTMISISDVLLDEEIDWLIENWDGRRPNALTLNFLEKGTQRKFWSRWHPRFLRQDKLRLKLLLDNILIQWRCPHTLFSVDDFAKLKKLTVEERQWCENNYREIEELMSILGSRERLHRFLTRMFDYLHEYPDLDSGGDWTLVRQIIFMEITLDEYFKSIIAKRKQTLEDLSKLKIVSDIQRQIESMIKTLGANRKARRQETKEAAKIFWGVEKIEEAKDRRGIARKEFLEQLNDRDITQTTG